MTPDPIDEDGRAAREEVAGIVDLFGALTRSELRRALSELAFKRGTEIDDGTVAATIDRAIREYVLVDVTESMDAIARDGSGGPDADTSSDGNVDADHGTLLLAGPTAFPVLPPNAEDLPYILDVPDRGIDRSRAGKHVKRRLNEEVEAAIAAGRNARLETLLEVTYDLETWAPVEVDDVRERIEKAIDGNETIDHGDPNDGKLGAGDERIESEDGEIEAREEE